MKTQIYFANWAESGRSGMMDDFNIDESSLKDCTILYAWYEYEDYSGSAVVIFERLGQLYEVVGSHCSCFGLEDQWSPEETSLVSLENEQNWQLIRAPGIQEFVDNLINDRRA